MVPFSFRRASGVLLALAGLGPLTALAQTPPPGRAHLFVLDLTGTPVGEFPTSIKQLKGSMEVALKDGVPMLKASVSSEFLITLPQGLPADFTLEFDLVPKGCCNPQDLSFEGTPTINQGAGSAHVLWDSDGYLAIIGGGGTTYEAPMPEDLRAILPGVLTNVVAVVQGPTIRLYTNGRRHYTLDKNFARTRVLRVFLGVDLARQDPVYLAGLRILAGAFPPTAGIASSSSALSGSGIASAPQGTISAVGGSAKPPGTVVGVPTPVPVSAPSGPGVTSGPIPARTPAPAGIQTTATQSQASTGGSVPTTVSNVSVTQGTLGPVVSWQPVSVAAGYLVRRWKIDDATCCNNASPASAPLAGPPWQDAPPPVAGTYVYEVTATMSGGVASGQAQFVHLTTGGTIASTLPTAAAAGAPIVYNAPSGPATSSPVSRTGALPQVLSVKAVVDAPPLAEYVRVTWTILPVPYVISVRRWKSDDPNCCNLSTGPIGSSVALGDPLLQKGVLPGTYIYEVTATTSTGTVVGQTQFTVVAPVLVAPPSGTALPISPGPVAVPSSTSTGIPAPPPPPGPPPIPTVTAPIAAQTGQPVPMAPGSVPAGKPVQNINIMGTPAYATVGWSSPITGMRGLVYSVHRWLESDPACCSTQVSGLTSTRFVDEGTQWPGSYIYRIGVTYSDGSVGSVDAKWMRPDPVNPANFRGTPGSGTVTLQWDAVLDASWYELFGPGLPAASFQVINNLFVVRNLAPGTYTWRIGSYYSSPKAPAPVSSPAAAFPQVTVVVP